MGTLIGLVILSCLVIVLVGSRQAWQRKPCPVCGSYNPAHARRCAYCTTWLSASVDQV